MPQPILSLQNVTIYQENTAILSDINLEVAQGDFIYIIGKTGSGKSSFMKTLYADLPLTDGEGTFVGFDLATLKEFFRILNYFPTEVLLKICYLY